MVLLTPRTLEKISNVFHQGSQFGCHPYRWNKNTAKAEVSSSYWQKSVWIFNVVLSIGYYAVIVFQWHEINASDTASTAEKTLMRFALVYFSFPVFYHLAIVTTFREFPRFVNMYLRYNQQFYESHVPPARSTKKLGKLCELCVVCAHSCIWLDFYAVLIAAFFRPSSADQIWAETFNPLRLLRYVLFAYYMVGFMVNSCLLTLTALGFFFSTFQILQEFGTPNHQWMENNEPGIVIPVYKILFLLVMEVNRVYGVIKVAAKIALMLMVTFCVYGAIRLEGVIAVALGVLGGTLAALLGVLMSAWSEFPSSSTRALLELDQASSQESGVEQKRLRSEILSLRPLQISMWGVYVIDKEVVLTVFRIILRGCNILTGQLLNSAWSIGVVSCVQ